MSTNVELIGNEPLALEGETFLLVRNGIDLEASFEGLPTLAASGRLFLTSDRLVFVPTQPTFIKKAELTLTSFAVSLRSYKDEKFNQPVFGCNNLSGKTDTGVYFKFYFKTGGAGVFLPCFRRALHAIRVEVTSERRAELTQDLLNQAKTLAAGDPNDPSFVYVSVGEGRGAEETNK